MTISIILLSAAIIASYYLVIFLAFRKKALSILRVQGGKKWTPPSENLITAFPHQLIDKPSDQLHHEEAITLQQGERIVQTPIEIVDDEESLLLKAAEIVVERIQDTVNRYASSPTTPMDLQMAIRSIVSQYQIFNDTDYFDAINSFISIAAERDCSVQFSKSQLLELWK